MKVNAHKILTAEEVQDRWMNWIASEDRVMTKEDVNNFCNWCAYTYEEYMFIWNVLEDFLEGFEEMPEQ